MPPTERGKKPMNQPLLSVNNRPTFTRRAKALAMSLLIYGRGSAGHRRGIRLREDHAAEINSARLTPQQGEIHYENRSLYA